MPRKSKSAPPVNVEELKGVLTEKRKPKRIQSQDLLSTGSTLLNLACSGRPEGGFKKGTYTFLVGDSASGKSFLTLTCLAEASINPHFDNYRFIYDNVEDGALMDLRSFFGAGVAERMESPSKSGNSTSIEEFYYHIDDAFYAGKPFIYILDSMDSLTSEDEQKKFNENKSAHRNGKALSGSYGDGKAKKNSSGIRQLLPKLRDSGSILIVISQTRDNIGFGAQFNPKTRSGGNALRFYASLEIWSSIREHIKRSVRSKPRQVGILCSIKMKKNRLTGQENIADIEFPIYWSTGIDDIGSCVSYLVEEKHWKSGKEGVSAPEFDFKGSEEDLIRWIETNEMEEELRSIVATVWSEIESACAVERKPRYG